MNRKLTILLQSGISFLATPILSPFQVNVRAEVYFSEEEAASRLFPGVALKPQSIELTPSQIEEIERRSDEDVRAKRIRIWKGPNGETVYIDQVVGKHEFITYAIAITADGKVKEIEILEYKETYGSEVRKADWRQQFVGKGPSDPIKVKEDIKNISGATLSSVHVADGVRRIIHTHQVIKNAKP